MRTILVLAGVALFALALLVGCAKPPTEQMAAAEKAIADAKTAEANIYAPELFNQAQQQFDAGNTQVTEKDYAGALQNFTTALQTANNAKDAVPNKKKEIQAKVVAEKEPLDKMIKEFEGKLKAAKKMAKADKAAAEATLTAAKADFAKLDAEAAANPMNAMKLVETIKVKLGEVQKAIEAAVPAKKEVVKKGGDMKAMPAKPAKPAKK